MTPPPTRLHVAFGDDTPPDGWLATTIGRAGCPVEPATAALPAVCDGTSDVVVFTSPVTVSDGWLEAMGCRPDGLAVGTVSAPAVAPADELAVRRAAHGLGAPLATDAPGGPCVLLTREALQLLGPPEGADVPGAVADFAARAARAGLANLVADRMAVGGAADDLPGHARTLARQRARGVSVTIDARSLTAGGAGTQVHTLELVRGLAARDRLRLRVVLPPREDTDPDALAALGAMADVEVRSYDDVVNSGIRTDVVHRPYQVFTVHDLRLLQRLGDRIVITHQDQLLFRNPAYFASTDEWEDYRQVCRIALAWADRVAFFTEHARREALRDELLEPQQGVVVPIGVDREPVGGAPARRPGGLEQLGDRPFLLALGTDLAHKNRPFAIRVLRELRQSHGWDGALVLAGPAAAHGATRSEEEQLARDLGGALITVGRVDEAGRRWLLDRCAALVFASVEEGFGLPPFEAAAAGRPCLFAPLGAMAETLPREAALIVPWDAHATAARLRPVLEPGPARDAHVALLDAAAASFTWERTAERLEQLYDAVLAAPQRTVAPIVAAEIAHQERYEQFRARTGDDGMSLLGPDGFLPPDMVRPLLGVLSRPSLRRGLFAALNTLYRVGHRSR